MNNADIFLTCPSVRVKLKLNRGNKNFSSYPAQASASNELDITEGEQLQALGEVGDGWIRVSFIT